MPQASNVVSFARPDANQPTERFLTASLPAIDAALFIAGAVFAGCILAGGGAIAVLTVVLAIFGA